MTNTLVSNSLIPSRLAFIITTSIILLVLMAMQIINKRFWMHDFEVYYKATQAFMNGEQVYGLAFGLDSGFYKYSPFALFLFLPLSLLPFGIAKVIYFLLIAVATITTLLFSAKLLGNNSGSSFKYSNGMLFLLLAIISSQVFRELHLGNINMILLLLLLISLQLLLTEKHVAAGLLFSIILFIKPHFIILVPLLFMRKYYKCLWITFLGLLFGVLLTAMVSGIEGSIILHKQWFQTMQIHNQSLLQAPDTVYSWLYQTVFYFFVPETSTFAKLFPLMILILIAAFFAWFVLANIRSESKTLHTGPQKQSFVIEFVLLVALIPNLVLTDSEHFLLSIPIILLFLGLLKQNRQPYWFSGLTIIGILLFAMNIHDLVGASISIWLTQNGILGLGNLMLIALAIYWFRKQAFSSKIAV
jgi:hypothetical protein